MELLLFPKIAEFAKQQGFKIIHTTHQNFYPDVTFVDRHDNRYAVDLKSTYRVSSTQVNGMTLGAFTGYFRDRKSTKNIMLPYESYVGHFVLGLIYERCEMIDEQKFFDFVDVEKMPSVARNFDFFVQEKYLFVKQKFFDFALHIKDRFLLVLHTTDRFTSRPTASENNRCGFGHHNHGSGELFLDRQGKGRFAAKLYDTRKRKQC